MKELLLNELWIKKPQMGVNSFGVFQEEKLSSDTNFPGGNPICRCFSTAYDSFAHLQLAYQ